MTPLWILLGAALAVDPPTPTAIVIATSRGERRVPVATHQGHPALAASPLAQWLPLSVAVRGGWVEVGFGGRSFDFLLDAPVVLDGTHTVPLAGGAYRVGDTVFVPLQFLTEIIPARFSEGYRWDPLAARFEERHLVPVARTPSPAPRAANAWGLRHAHTVVIDPGHGGTDPGTAGRYLPRGVTEKHIALQIARRVAAELERRGVRARLTRTTDTLIDFEDRSAACRDDCVLFASVHVDALPRSSAVNGIHTYFLGVARTEDARRVTALENDATRYESGRPLLPDDPLRFIQLDLQNNEAVRESAVLAAAVQRAAAAVHPGRNRGVEQAGWLVLLYATRPAILIETGFGTNRRDAEFLASTAGQQRLAVAIADGITEYLRRYEAKTGTGGAP